MDKPSNSYNNALHWIDRNAVRDALKAIGTLETLGELPLAYLQIVKVRRKINEHGDNAIGRGVALRQVLENTFEQLKPSKISSPDYGEKRWRYYLILRDVYLDRLPNRVMMDRLDLSLSHYKHEKGQALDALAGLIRQQEQLYTSTSQEELSKWPVIPSLPRNLVGRDEIKIRIVADLEAGWNVSLYGMGGIGKTALASSVAHMLKERGETVLWVEVRRRAWENLYDQIGRIFDDHAVLSLKSDAKLSHVHGILAKQAIDLIVLDDVRDGMEARRFERKALPTGCNLIITARKRTGIGRPYDVTRLSESDSLSLFCHYTKFGIDEDVRQICALLGGHPMALEIAGRMTDINGLSPAELYAQICKRGKRVKLLKLSQHTHENIWASLLLSYEALGETEKLVFHVFGALWTTTATAELIALAVDIDEHICERLLNNIASYSLIIKIINSNEPKQYRVHDLISDFAFKILIDANKLSGAREMLLDAYVEYANRYAVRSYKAHNYLNAEKNNLLAAAEWAGQQGYWAVVNQLAFDLWDHSDFLNWRSYAREAVQLLHWGVKATRILGNRINESRQLSNLGTAYLQLGNLGEAIDCYRQALMVAQEVEDQHCEGIAWGYLGTAYRQQGQIEKAKNCFGQALRISRNIGNRQSEGIHLGSLARMYLLQNQLEKAVDHYEQALQITQELGNRGDEQRYRGGLGLAYIALEQVAKGVEYIHEALAIAQEIDNRRWQAYHLANLGCAFAKQSDLKRAEELYNQALDIHRDVGDRRGVSEWLHCLGDLVIQSVEHMSGSEATELLKQAIAYYEEALAIRREIKDYRAKETATALEEAQALLGDLSNR